MASMVSKGRASCTYCSLHWRINPGARFSWTQFRPRNRDFRGLLGTGREICHTPDCLSWRKQAFFFCALSRNLEALGISLTRRRLPLVQTMSKLELSARRLFCREIWPGTAAWITVSKSGRSIPDAGCDYSWNYARLCNTALGMRLLGTNGTRDKSSA